MLICNNHSPYSTHKRQTKQKVIFNWTLTLKAPSRHTNKGLHTHRITLFALPITYCILNITHIKHCLPLLHRNHEGFQTDSTISSKQNKIVPLVSSQRMIRIHLPEQKNNSDYQTPHPNPHPENQRIKLLWINLICARVGQDKIWDYKNF